MSDVGGVSVRSEYSFICYQLIESAEHMRLDSSAPGYVVLYSICSVLYFPFWCH